MRLSALSKWLYVDWPWLAVEKSKRGKVRFEQDVGFESEDDAQFDSPVYNERNPSFLL